jgi:ribosome-associated toxin RatA of RatAB toxin-antitoxin module
MLIWLVVILGTLVGLVLLVAAIGAMLPRAHVARTKALIPAPPARVAAMVRDVEAQPRWRRGVTAIEVVERRADGLLYIERQGRQPILFDFAETVPDTRFTGTIADPKLPFGGTWTFDLMPEGEGTRVRIVEDGEVRNRVFRFVAKFVFGHEATMRRYLADLERAVAEG